MVKLTEDNFKRPKITYTDKLSEKEIKSKLINYKRLHSVDELNEIPLGEHMRYFSYVDDEYKFRMGGILLNKNGLPKYIVLANGKKSWCVQTNNTVFFKRMSNKEIVSEYAKVIENQTKKIKNLKNQKYDKTKVIKYDNIEGILMDCTDLEEGMYVNVANKRKKKYYGTMFIYSIVKANKTIIEIRTVDDQLDKYIFDPDDYYYYAIKPTNKDSIVKAVHRVKNYSGNDNKN